MKGERVATAVVCVALVVSWLAWIARPANQRDVLQANQAATSALLEATQLRAQIGQHDKELVEGVNRVLSELATRVAKLEAQAKPAAVSEGGGKTAE